MDDRAGLRADCNRCAALCCVAPAFAASADFAITKPAGLPCPELRPDFRCGIHASLRERGFPGCAAFDCFGAGQHVTQMIFAGRDWRQEPQLAAPMSAAFAAQRQLHELLWYLAEALTLVRAGPPRRELTAVRTETDRLRAGHDGQAGHDRVSACQRAAGPLLAQVSELVRAKVPDRAPDRRGADLTGAKLRGADLHGASLRGSYLLGADLRGADLRGTDLLGADLRGADLRGATLAGAIFLTQPQLAAAAGDAATVIPPALTRPLHWHGREQ
jgi:Pentapeptide repeats (8 copies)